MSMVVGSTAGEVVPFSERPTTAARSARKALNAEPAPRLGSIRARIIDVARRMEPLKKNDRNPEGGWSYVSIDDYYATAAKALLDVGLSWVPTEIDNFMAPSGNQCHWCFRFDAYADDGEEWPDAMRVTIVHPVDGPQMTGKVVSYAEKVFLRALLKLVTGEPDADASSPNGLKKTRPSARDIAYAEQHAQRILGPPKTPQNVDALLRLMEAATSATELDAVVQNHRALINHFRRNDPDVYRKVADRRTELLRNWE